MLHWSCLLMAVISMFSCGKEKDTVYLRSEEEIRLDESCHIDTTALRAVLNPDTIEGWEQLSQLTAEAWMLIDDSTGVVISQKNAYQRMFPASLTKMMTCLLTLENGEKGDTIEITEDVYIEHDCRVRLGDQYLLGDLLHEMMMQSDNGTARTLPTPTACPTTAPTARHTTCSSWLATVCATRLSPRLWAHRSSMFH